MRERFSKIDAAVGWLALGLLAVSRCRRRFSEPLVGRAREEAKAASDSES